MKDFLQEHGSEVQNMLFEEWDWEQYVAVQKEESRAEGRKAGLAEGEAKMLSRLVRSMAKTADPEEISRAIEIPLAKVLSILSPAPN